MSSKRLAIRSVAFNWLGRAASLLIAFIVTPIIIKGLGREGYGIWAIVMSVAGYYALADFGIRGAAVKYISQYSAGKDQESLKQVLAVSVRLYALLAAATLAISGLMAWVFPYVFDIQQQSTASVRWAAFLCGAAVSVRLLGQVFRAALEALIRFDARNALAIAAQCLEAILMIAAVWSGYGLAGMAAAVLFVALLDQAANLTVSLRLLGPVSFSKDQVDRDMARKLIRFSSLNILVNTAGRASKFSNPIIIGIMLGPVAVPFYAVADALTQKAWSLTKGVTSVMMPLSGRLQAEGRHDDLAIVLIQTARVLLAMSLAISVVFVVMGHSLVRLWIGPEFSVRTYPLLCVLTAGFAVTMISGGIPSMLTGTGRIRIVAIVQLTRAIVTLGLSVLFVSIWGTIGAAWAVLLPRIVSHGFVFPVCASRHYGVTARSYLLQVCVPAVAATLPGLVVALLFASYAEPGRLLEWFGEAAIVAAVCGIATFLVCLDVRLQKEVLQLLWPGRRETAAAQENTAIQDQASP